MPTTVRDVMTTDVQAVGLARSVADAARIMRTHDIGDVLVLKDDGGLCGIVTDRDIAIETVAAGIDPNEQTVDEVCSHSAVTVSLDSPAAEAAQIMRDNAIRRLPVVDGDDLVGIVSIGDLSVEMDRNSALGAISAADPNN